MTAKHALLATIVICAGCGGHDCSSAMSDVLSLRNNFASPCQRDSDCVLSDATTRCVRPCPRAVSTADLAEYNGRMNQLDQADCSNAACDLISDCFAPMEPACVSGFCTERESTDGG